MKLFTIQYITAWGNPAEKKLISNHVRNVIAKFERIKPNATIQKVYKHQTETIYEEVYNG